VDAGAGTEDREPGQRRSRDRYGRDRGERGARNERGERSDASGQSVNAQAEGEQEVEHVVRASYFTQPAAAPAPVLAEVQHTEAPVDSTPAAAPMPEAAPVQATASAVAPSPALASAAMPKVSGFALPLEELQSVAQSSGLQWVNSDPARIAAVQAAIAAEVPVVHPPRERPAPVAIDQGRLGSAQTADG